MRGDFVGLAIGITEFSVVEWTNTTRLSAVVLDISIAIGEVGFSLEVGVGPSIVGGSVVVSFS